VPASSLPKVTHAAELPAVPPVFGQAG
jgi:hypothetical protein